MAMKRNPPERLMETRHSGSPKLTDVEYRVVWNKTANAWNVFRNGAATGVSPRKKKKSAVDSAIRDAKAELGTSQTVIAVICVEGRTTETVWRGP